MTLPPLSLRSALLPRLLTLVALLLLVAGAGLLGWPGNAAPETPAPPGLAGRGTSRAPHTPALPPAAHPGPHEPTPGSGTPGASGDEPLGASALEGTVVDESGRPIAGAQLHLYQLDPGRLGDLAPEERSTHVHDTASGEDGTFLLEARRPGAHRVTVYHPSFRMTALPVTLPAREARLVLRRGASLEVTVLDEDGLPLAGSEVQLLPSSRPGHTDSAGKTLLEALEPGRRRVAAATPEDEPLRAVGAEVELVDGRRTSVVLRFPRAPKLSGVVVDGRGQPVVFAEVRAAPASLLESAFGEGDLSPFSFRARREWRSGTSLSWYTGGSGRFTLERLPPGPLLVGAFRSGYALDERTTPGPVRTFEGRPGVLTTPGAGEVRLVMKALARMHGRVVRADGSPVTRFTLDGDPYEDEQGAFGLSILRDGKGVLVFSAPGLASTRREVRFQEGVDVDLGEVVLESGREVRLRVVDADTGRPVEGAFVDVRDPADTGAGRDTSLLYPSGAPGHWEREKMRLTDGEGVVRLPAVEERPRVVRVEHCGYLGTWEPLGARQGELTVALRPGARVEGAVSVGGEVSGHGRVEVRTAEGGRAAFADIRDGRYRTCALEAGRYAVQVELHVFENRTLPSHGSRWVEVAARGTVTVDFDAPGEGALVRVRSPSGPVGRLLLVPGTLGPPLTRGAFLEAEARAHSAMYESGGGEPEGYIFRLIPPGLYTLLAVRDERARPVEVHVEELWVPEPGTVLHELRPRWQRGPDSLPRE